MMKINVTIAKKGEDLSDRSLITGLIYKDSDLDLYMSIRKKSHRYSQSVTL